MEVGSMVNFAVSGAYCMTSYSFKVGDLVICKCCTALTKQVP